MVGSKHMTWSFANEPSRRTKRVKAGTTSWLRCSASSIDLATLGSTVSGDGSVAPRPRGGGWRPPIDPVVLYALVPEDPDATSEELCRACNGMNHAARTSPASVLLTLARAGYVVKKNGGVQANATDPTFSAVVRHFARDQKIDPRRLVAVDEASVNGRSHAWI
jgi:hypothetical protein